jgi:predicted dehydrogenase
MLWVASHGIDAIWFATGKRFARIIARGGNLSQPDYGSLEDHVTAMFELENGASGLVHADYLRPAAAPSHGDDRLRVAGSNGVVEVRGGRCVFIGADSAEADVTEGVTVQPMHLELLAALRGESKDLYSTQESLETAAVLLHARDAQDRQDWVKCT